MNRYPSTIDENIKDCAAALRYISRERDKDIRDFNNLPNVFIRGRKVARVPSAANDVIAGDVVGDFNVTATYAYFLIDNAGTAEWRRVAVASW